MDGWLRPAQTSPEIRRDLRAYLLGVPPREDCCAGPRRCGSSRGPRWWRGRPGTG
ncbi:hypothetical protein ACFQVA_22170 [Actinomadura keratinilytica]